MNSKSAQGFWAMKWGRILGIVLLLALLASLMPAASAPVARAQPVLLVMAARNSGAQVGVIVQKTARGARVEDLVVRLGGTITKDLRIINAFAARLPAKAVPELAKAAGVRWMSLDAPVVGAGRGKPPDPKPTPTPVPWPPNYYLDTLSVRRVWDMGLQGQGIGVAVIDSGITQDPDLSNIQRQMSFSSNSMTVVDVYGHGTHVAGIVAGNGMNSGGTYMGMAPGVSLLGLKISDELGMAYESDTVAAMQWVLDNKSQYNIRVVNLSINSTMEQSYHASPLDAAAEILWFNGIVVVASAGNKGPGTGPNTIDAAPANDPFIITVGASDEKANLKIRDDSIAPFSAYGTTMDGFVKPDIIAPGKDIISVLARHSHWNSVNWNSVNWNSVNWNSVNWNSVNWNSTYWAP
jgi:serine protease AprX